MSRGIFNQDQIHLREAANILQVHTLSNILTLDGLKIKKGVTEGFLEDM